MTLFGLGVGSRVAEQLARKGMGRLDLVDHDIVAPSNLSRTYYFPGDVGQLKAFALARNLAKAAVYSTVVKAFPVQAQQYFLRHKPEFDAAICLVDDEASREFVSRQCTAMARPCIFGAASVDANSCRIFVQEPDKACYGCSGGFGGARSCGPLPAIVDVQAVLASMVVYAADTLLMPRPRNWNLRQIFLGGGDFARHVERDPHCPICGGRR